LPESFENFFLQPSSYVEVPNHVILAELVAS